MDNNKNEKSAIFNVFQCVTKYREQKLMAAKAEERTPYIPIEPEIMQDICAKAGVTDVEASQIVSFCVSVIGGILSYSDYANTLKADNMGEIIVQIENIKAIK